MVRHIAKPQKEIIMIDLGKASEATKGTVIPLGEDGDGFQRP